MKFYQRFAYYLLGLLLGGILVYWFLTAKASSRGVEFCYLPNCRVLKDIRSKPFYYSDIASEKLAQKWLDTIDIQNTLRYGDVDFDLSNVPTDGGKLYVVEGKTIKNQPITIEVINFSDKVLLRDIKK
uniref:DUF4258 domain-containing protein n=1 Tax=Flavobacterium sp. TaxID=239 RepID=UPI00404AF28A